MNPRQTRIEALLGNETVFRATRRAYQPHLCPRLAAGSGLTRPLPGFDLEVMKFLYARILVTRDRVYRSSPAETHLSLSVSQVALIKVIQVLVGATRWVALFWENI